MTDKVEYEFLFVVDGVTLDDERTVGVLTDAFDGILSWNDGLCRLAVSSPGADALDALDDLLTRLASKSLPLKIRRLDPDLVGISDIAERTGRTRQNVQQWVTGERNSENPFPSAEGCAGRSHVWRWADVNEWLKPLGFDDGETRPTRDESALLDAMLVAWRDPHRESGIPGNSLTEFLTRRQRRRSSTPDTPRRNLSFHQNLVARIPRATGRGLAEWFVTLESGPSFLRREERANWLADEHGISDRYAAAIVHEWEVLRRQRLSGSYPTAAEDESQPPIVPEDDRESASARSHRDE